MRSGACLPVTPVRSGATCFALACIQVAAVATYFLSAWAKFRFGTVQWANGAVFAWAIVRRGTALGDELLRFPAPLRGLQWSLLCLELAPPLLLLPRHRLRRLAVLGFAAFHLTTYLVLKIHFLPLVICLLAFVPLEDLRLPRRAPAVPSPEEPVAV